MFEIFSEVNFLRKKFIITVEIIWTGPAKACPLLHTNHGMQAILAPIGTFSKSTIFPDSLQDPASIG